MFSAQVLQKYKLPDDGTTMGTYYRIEQLLVAHGEDSAGTSHTEKSADSGKLILEN